jgi:hypothetical protein
MELDSELEAPVDTEVLETVTDETPDDQSEPEHSEEYARRLGWRPKDEFKGSADNWMDWEAFLDEDKSSAPQLKAQVKLLRRRLDQADKRMAKAERTFEEAREYFSKAEQRAYDRAIKDIKAKQLQAVQDGDVEAFAEAEAELDELGKDMKAAPKPDADMQRVFKAWQRENDWYGSDDAMTAVADRIAQKMGSCEEAGLEPDEYLEEMAKRVRKEFPHKFKTEELPRKRPAVGGVSTAHSARGAETFGNMPADAKAQFKRFKDQGIPVTEEGFAKDYWAEMKKEARR